ncbi:MAG: hypothetical protein R3F42_07575 [Pseudomonadota bacterium]
MTTSDRSAAARSAAAHQRTVGAVRTVLITYGVTAFGYLFTRAMPTAAAPALGGLISARGLVLLGLGLQLALLIAGVLLRRRLSDRTTAAQRLGILELAGDGLTVLVFALGTYGAILNAATDI